MKYETDGKIVDICQKHIVHYCEECDEDGFSVFWFFRKKYNLFKFSTTILEIKINQNVKHTIVQIFNGMWWTKINFYTNWC